MGNFLLSLLLLGARHRAALPASFPACGVIQGTPAVTFSRDGGVTLAPVALTLSGVGYTYGLAALDARTLLAIHKQTLSISTDAGCHWSAVGDLAFDDFFPPRIAAAGGDRAYLWSDRRQFLARYSGGGITILKAPAAVVGMGVDSKNADHVRLGDVDGTLWDSTDAGRTWRVLSARVFVQTNSAYRIAFDPADIDHVVFGGSLAAPVVTFDGGKSFVFSRGLGTKTNVFNIVVSPADGRVVWAMAIDIGELDANAPSQGRHIYRSVDGGASFVPVVDEGPDVHLINGPLMAAHPTNPDILYFVFGTYFAGHGTDLYRYDAADHSLTTTHHAYDDFDAIVFSPADPSVMYFGLEVVQLSQP